MRRTHDNKMQYDRSLAIRNGEYGMPHHEPRGKAQVSLSTRLYPMELEACERAAKEAGMSTAAWARATILRALGDWDAA